MSNRQLVSTEKTLKEYPRSTRRVQGHLVVGVGNLILTNRRLIFLHQVQLSDQQIENIRNMSEHSATDRIADFALTLDDRNFQIPLSSVISVKVGLYSLLPLLRPCLRITYQKKKGETRTESFMFTIPLLRGFFQAEIIDVLMWVLKIRKAVKEAR